MKVFSKRERIRHVKFWGGVVHLVSLVMFILGLLWLYPKSVFRQTMESGVREEALTLDRQRALEALDKLVRYEEYYKELHGRYTSDFTRLLLPERLSSGTWEDVRRHYELSVLDLSPNRLLVLAVDADHADRIAIDELHRISANFVLPTISRSYLYEEADRLIRLSRSRQSAADALSTSYWRVQKTSGEYGDTWFAVGIKAPVFGEKRELVASDGREVASIFSSVSDQLKRRLSSNPLNEFTLDDVTDFLRAAREAEHIYKHEQGHYARSWEELESVSGYHFLAKQERATNIRVQPIAVSSVEENFQITLEGTKGSLLGEQFVMDDDGDIRELRYTDALVHQLQESTKILNALPFQISADPVDSAPGSLTGKNINP